MVEALRSGIHEGALVLHVSLLDLKNYSISYHNYVEGEEFEDIVRTCA